MTAASRLATEGSVLASQIPQALSQAFGRFTEASEALSAHYHALQREVEGLRRELAAKDEELKRSEKLRLLGQTAAAIAHEVRNPLGAMKLFVSLLREDVASVPSAGSLLDQLDQCLIQLDGFVSNILHFSRPITPHAKDSRTPLAVESIVRSEADPLLAAHHAKIKIEYSWNGVSFVRGSEPALRALVRNLLLNAVQAVKGKGTIWISSGSASDGGFTLSVTDSGPGIPSEIAARLFDPFVTTKAAGTGLGLAIARQVAEQHGGTLTAKNSNEAGKGAVFTLHLPGESKNPLISERAE